MEHKIFLANDWKGISRAECINGAWRVETLLPDTDIHCLAGDPHSPARAYAGTRHDGILRSDDGGKTWQPIGLAGIPVKSIAVDPMYPDTIYAGSKPVSLYVTHDGGKAWEELTALRAERKWWWFSPAEPPGITPYVQAVTVAPGNSSRIACGIELGAVLVSEDGGKSWSGHRNRAIRDCHSLRFHHSNPNWLYEGGAGSRGCASISKDGGRTWQQAKNALGNYGWKVAADPARPEVWYVSAAENPSLLRGEFTPPAHNDGNAKAHIFRSVGGAPLEKLRGGLPEPLDYMAYALEIDPKAPGHLYAGLANGDVWHTADHGDTWTQLPLNLNAIHTHMLILNGT